MLTMSDCSLLMKDSVLWSQSYLESDVLIGRITIPHVMLG